MSARCRKKILIFFDLTVSKLYLRNAISVILVYVLIIVMIYECVNDERVTRSGIVIFITHNGFENLIKPDVCVVDGDFSLASALFRRAPRNIIN